MGSFTIFALTRLHQPVDGGPWTQKFQDIFDGANMTLQDNANIVYVLGHQGPHPEAYHATVLERLTSALEPYEKGTAKYESVLRDELGRLGREIQTPGTILNKLVTGQK
jgi:filamentous hemagglutinin